VIVDVDVDMSGDGDGDVALSVVVVDAPGSSAGKATASTVDGSPAQPGQHLHQSRQQRGSSCVSRVVDDLQEAADV
jgi:hypothetical protein